MASKNRKLRGAIVGFGRIAEDIHYPAFLKSANAEIISIADISEKRRVYLKSKMPDLNIFKSCEDLLVSEKLDFIDIAAPPYAHAKIIRSAIEKGTHVICEKPISLEPKEIKEIACVAAKNKVVIYPVSNYKKSFAAKRIKQIIDSGMLGNIKKSTISILKPHHRKGTTEWRPDWRRQKKYSGGGVLMDYGPHIFALVNYFSIGRPKKTIAKISCFDNKLYPEVEDNILLHSETPNAGIDVNLSWTNYCGETIYTIEGSNGKLTNHNRNYRDILKIETKNGHSEENYPDLSNPEHPNWLSPIIAEFVEKIEKKDYFNTELEEAIAGIEWISKTYQIAKIN